MVTFLSHFRTSVISDKQKSASFIFAGSGVSISKLFVIRGVNGFFMQFQNGK
ncbi:MAG: hypothetical protein UR18_C0006G0046 [Candidatus Nomurabacteria bacterium GW2011_GWE2_31_40]|nr:MAG: hypothetical protein UR18_C0006G0046 [Candidatus Nomurabacteria bacterium GW2011_GWE2_31_40]